MRPTHRQRSPCRGDRGEAFTLIELLIVIAIIAILALIAVPNFLEAQVRAKVSRSRADLRTVAGALEAYAVDWGDYPPNDGTYSVIPRELTTPVAFVTNAALVDPFGVGIEEQLTFTYATSPYYTYMRIVTMEGAQQSMAMGRPCPREAIDHWSQNYRAFEKYGHWRMLGLGPDRAYLSDSLPPPLRGSDTRYDPTNGTLSFGNLIRTQSRVD